MSSDSARTFTSPSESLWGGAGCRQPDTGVAQLWVILASGRIGDCVGRGACAG